MQYEAFDEKSIGIADRIAARDPTFTLAEGTADGIFVIEAADDGQPVASNEIDQPVEEVVFELGDDEPEIPNETAEAPILDVDDPADDLGDPASDEPVIEEELPVGDEAEEPAEGETEEPVEGKTEKPAEEPAEGETEEPAEEPAAFVATEGVVTVSAAPGVFPAGAALTVSEPEPARMLKRSAAQGETVVASYAYEITVTDAEGNPVQPAEGTTATVAFALSEASDPNLSVRVLHETEGGQETLHTYILDGAVVAETKGFSRYTVEFYYNEKDYVLEGDSSVALSEILAAVGLSGEATDVAVSDESLFSASDETGEWVLTARQAFDTAEWMTVTINGITYEITVTDDQEIATWTELQAALNAGGTVILTYDLTPAVGDAGLYVPEGVTVTLDLAGHTLDRALGDPVNNGYVIKNDGTLTIKDSSADQTGRITGGKNSWGGSGREAGAIEVDKGTVNLQGGIITGNFGQFAGAVVVEEKGTFNMTGGQIINNSTNRDGSGVKNSGVFNLCGRTKTAP